MTKCLLVKNTNAKSVKYPEEMSWITVLTDTQGDTQVGETRYQDGQQGTFRDSCLGVL